jgi:hypothetical protein
MLQIHTGCTSHPRIRRKCCAHLPRATRGVSFGPLRITPVALADKKSDLINDKKMYCQDVLLTSSVAPGEQMVPGPFPGEQMVPGPFHYLSRCSQRSLMNKVEMVMEGKKHGKRTKTSLPTT